jgi:cytochrome c oxidase subunit 2
MGMRVTVHAPDRFDAWVNAQRAPAVEPSGEPANVGRAIFARSACVGCHTIRGISAGTLGPDLTHFGSRATLAAGMLPNTPENVVKWVRDAPAIKPGVKMPPFTFTDGEAQALAAYLTALK